MRSFPDASIAVTTDMVRSEGLEYNYPAYFPHQIVFFVARCNRGRRQPGRTEEDTSLSLRVLGREDAGRLE